MFLRNFSGGTILDAVTENKIPSWKNEMGCPAMAACMQSFFTRDSQKNIILNAVSFNIFDLGATSHLTIALLLSLLHHFSETRCAFYYSR